VGPRAGLDEWEKPRLESDSIPDQPVASRYTDSAIPAHKSMWVKVEFFEMSNLVVHKIVTVH
jgi:hypothetical protein